MASRSVSLLDDILRAVKTKEPSPCLPNPEQSGAVFVFLVRQKMHKCSKQKNQLNYNKRYHDRQVWRQSTGFTERYHIHHHITLLRFYSKITME